MDDRVDQINQERTRAQDKIDEATYNRNILQNNKQALDEHRAIVRDEKDLNLTAIDTSLEQLEGIPVETRVTNDALWKYCFGMDQWLRKWRRVVNTTVYPMYIDYLDRVAQSYNNRIEEQNSIISQGNASIESLDEEQNKIMTMEQDSTGEKDIQGKETTKDNNLIKEWFRFRS